MGKIWLKSVDPSHVCCGCEGKAGPCDSCCQNLMFDNFVTLAQAQAWLDNHAINCLAGFDKITDPLISSSFSCTNIANTFTFLSSQSGNAGITPTGSNYAIYKTLVHVAATTNIRFDFTCDNTALDFPGNLTSVFGELAGTCGNTNVYFSIHNVDGIPNTGSFVFSNVQPGYYIIVLDFNGVISFPPSFPFTVTMNLTVTDLLNPTLPAYPIYVQYGPSPLFNQNTLACS